MDTEAKKKIVSVLIRMTDGKREDLKRCAAREGMSLQAYCMKALERGMRRTAALAEIGMLEEGK